MGIWYNSAGSQYHNRVSKEPGTRQSDPAEQVWILRRASKRWLGARDLIQSGRYICAKAWVCSPLNGLLWPLNGIQWKTLHHAQVADMFLRPSTTRRRVRGEGHL